MVVDEIHSLADPSRGAGLEMSLAKLLYSQQAPSAPGCSAGGRPPHGGPQIIGMSATMGGLESLRGWLGARLFLTNFRPVPLTEHAVFAGRVFRKRAPSAASAAADADADAVCQPGGAGCPLEEERELRLSDPRLDRDRLVPLVAEVVAAGHSALVFCATQRGAEACARLLTALLPRAVPPPAADLQRRRAGVLAGIRERLEGGEAGAELAAAVMAGVGFHHAGLTTQEREGVEAGYRSGALQVLAATSTLAAGINLPARRVVLRSLRQGLGPVSRAQYLQARL